MLVDRVKKLSSRVFHKEVIKYIIACLLFGAIPIATNNSSTAALQTTFIRILVAAFVLMVVFCCSRFRATLWDYTKLQLFFLVVSGTCIGLTYLILCDTGDKIGTTTTILTYSLGPALLLICSPFLFKEVELTPIKIIGFVICTFGVFLLDSEFIFSPGGLSSIRDVLLTAVFTVVIVYCNRQLEAIDGLENAMFQMIVAFIVIFVIYAWKADLEFQITGNDAWWLLVAGAINTGLPVYLYLSSIDELQADVIAFYGYIRPMTTVGICVFMYGERLTIEEILGVVCIFGGVILANLFKKKPTVHKNRTF